MWSLLCVCGFGRCSRSWHAIQNVAAWHRLYGCEGSDHVLSIERIKEAR